MILEIAALIASQFGITGLSILAYHRWIKPVPAPIPVLEERELTVTDLSKSYSDIPNLETISNEMVVEAIDAPEEVITAEEHLARLIKLYPEAAEAYRHDHSKKRLNNRADRYILRMILAVEAGDMTVKKTSHHMEFSNGDEIWTSNKYYGYGNLDNSPDNPHCTFSSSDARVSLYTFMRIVHLEETEFEPILRLKNKTIKVI